MSFTDLKISDLKKAAESFGVDVSDIKSKQEIIARLEEEGISYQMYDKFSNTDKQEIKVSNIEKEKREAMTSKEPKILVKMDRANHSYQTMGYNFTQEHPFVAMPESHAQKIFDNNTGFRVATPKEAQEYYA
jgi:parvulin-like peptidyl-prolyl isomerase